MQQTSSVLYGAFSAASHGHACASSSTTSRTTIKADLAIAAESAKRAHTKLVDDTVNTMVHACRAAGPGYQHPFCSINIMSDGAQLEVFLSKAAHERYGRGEWESKASGPSVVALFVQTQHCQIPKAGLGGIEADFCTDWVVTPFCMEDEQGDTMSVALAEDSIINRISPLVVFFFCDTWQSILARTLPAPTPKRDVSSSAS